MFSVIFEVQPRPGQWGAYLGSASLLRPELEQVDGVVDNVGYSGLTHEGWILSLSNWRDEKALVRWLRQVRVIRDYGMFDRREAPQYYPEQRRDAT